MKRILCLLMVFVMIFAVGCKKEEGTETQQPVTEKPATKEIIENVEELTDNEFIAMANSETRPLAVMIDNDGPSSRPQIGLESAYMVYEVIVEGGASRLMALFRTDMIEKVGPVRSSRHYFLDYALEHDAMYLHAGWSPKATNDISALKVNNINGIMGDDGTIFYRDNTYDKTWHNLYTKVTDAYKYAKDKKKYRVTSDKKYTWYSNKEFDLKDGTDALEIEVPYSTMYKVVYKYNPEKKIYERYIGTKPHTSQTGDILTAKNIIICHVRNYDLADGENKGRQELETVGTGTGYYITNGKAVEITWNKSGRTAATKYTLKNGKEITINPGNTYVQIVPMDSSVAID